MIDVPPSPASTTTPETAEFIYTMRGEWKGNSNLRRRHQQVICVETENSLGGNIHSGNIESLEHHLGRIFAVFLHVRFA